MSKVLKVLKKRKVLIIVLVILVVIGILIFNAVTSAQQAVNALLYTPSATPLVKQDIENVIVASGLTSSAEKRSVTMSEMPAGTGVEIISVDIEVGDTVKTGQVLATLDDEATIENIANAQESYDDNRQDIYSANALTNHDLAQAQGTVDSAAETFNTAKDDFNKEIQAFNEAIAAQNAIITQETTTTNNKITALLNTWGADEAALNTAYQNVPDKDNPVGADILTVNTYNEIATLRTMLAKTVADATTVISGIQAQIDSLTKSYSAQESANLKALESAQASLERQQLQAQSGNIKDQRTLDDLYENIITAQEGMEDTYLRAPIGGGVTEVNFSAGETLSGTFCVIQDLSAMEIATTVSSYDVVKLQEGMAATITTDSTAEVELKGTIKTIAPIAIDQQGNFQVVVSLEEGHENLRAGVPAKITFLLESSQQVFAVPIDAVMEEDGSHFVYVYDTLPTAEQAMLGEQDGRRRIDVALGLESDYLVEIISAELTTGMLVLDDPQGLNVAQNQLSAFGITAEAPPQGAPSGGGPGAR